MPTHCGVVVIAISSTTSNFCKRVPRPHYIYVIDRRPYSFNTSDYWLSFINVPLFFRDLQDPRQRDRMQPLVLAGLAMSILMKSSELELGHRGRELALHFRNSAQECLERACQDQTLDYTLAEAALVRNSCVTCLFFVS